jgi:regulator of RNase E activity RraB
MLIGDGWSTFFEQSEGDLKTWHVTTLTESGYKYSFAQHADAKELFDRHQRSEIIDRLGKATAKYDDWPCFLEIMRLELKILGIFD